jgi:hypothetical protein
MNTCLINQFTGRYSNLTTEYEVEVISTRLGRVVHYVGLGGKRYGIACFKLQHRYSATEAEVHHEKFSSACGPYLK